MTQQHFNEILYTIMLSTRSNKHDIADYLNISVVTLNKYTHQGLPKAKRFLIMDRLQEYFNQYLGGYESDKVRECECV